MLGEQFRKLLKQKIIRRGTSPYAAPVLVRKKEGFLRLRRAT